MILKKPYAFIIKHFRLIHLLMLGCLVFLLFVSRDINSLFTTLQSTSTYIYAGAAAYINDTVFLFIFILLFLAGIVFWLLREKKKPTRLYLLIIIYCIIQIVLYYYLFDLLGTLIDNVVESEQIILGRDLSIIGSIPCYPLMVICFIRGIGFNLKQFNFSKDIKELEIADKDSEEFEVLIGKNNYKYFRFIRRTIREIKYYILENKFAISVFASVLLLFFIGYGVYYYNQYLKKMGESESSSINNITYTVNSSYITSRDFLGEEISNYYKYVVVDMSFYNSSQDDRILDLDKITLTNGKLVYYPVLTRNQRFYDLGVSYNEGDKILPGEIKNATLTFEIPKSVTSRNFSLRIQYGLDVSGRKLITRYRQFDITAKNIDQKKQTIKKNINETINTNVIDKNEFNLTITGYNIVDSFNNRFVRCKNVNSCLALSNVVKPQRVNSETMLVIDHKSIIYESANFTKTLNNYNKIFNKYCTVEYVLFNKSYKTKAKIVSNSDVDGKIFIVMDRKLANASDITLYFDFRDNKYEVPLLSSKDVKEIKEKEL